MAVTAARVQTDTWDLRGWSFDVVLHLGVTGSNALSISLGVEAVDIRVSDSDGEEVLEHRVLGSVEAFDLFDLADRIEALRRDASDLVASDLRKWGATLIG